MIRGTTPTIIFRLNGIDNEDIKNIYFTIEQDENQLTKTEYEYENGVYHIKLTQEETLSFSEGQIKCQVKVLMLDGNVVASPIKKLGITDILMEEVVTWYNLI